MEDSEPTSSVVSNQPEDPLYDDDIGSDLLIPYGIDGVKSPELREHIEDLKKKGLIVYKKPVSIEVAEA